MPSLIRFAVFASALHCAQLVANAGDSRKPNILFIVGDDMGYADVGFHGCKDIPTPNLDALAKTGVNFTSGYVSAPYCSPSRAGLLTGRYQQKFGHEFNPSKPGTGMPVTETTIASRLKKVGYATGLVGKWHLGNLPEMVPQQRGFDEFFGFLGGAHSYFNWDGMLRGTNLVPGTEYFTDAFGKEACTFIERHKDQPWFLYLAFNAVHTPMQADDARLAKFANIQDKQRRTYAAMMCALDENIGRVRKKLVETGQEENTFVIFIADNGGPTMPGVTINGSVNDPLRGSKRTTLEGGIRVPFVVNWKGHIKSAVYDKPVIQLDLTATAFELAGVKVPNADGVNLLPYLSGQKSGAPHDALYWRFGEQMAIRVGDFKLVRYDSNVDTRTGKMHQPVTAPKLYNLASDIGESKDLSNSMPEKMKELQAKWDAWNATLMKPLWGFSRGDNDGDPGEKDKTKKKKKA
jgi:arylsulfatase A-like enzyme